MCDLLFNLASPSVMDCKMGQRTYVEDEVCQSAEEVRLRPVSSALRVRNVMLPFCFIFRLSR